MKAEARYKPGDRIGGRYQVHKALLGGMGEVYLCLDLEENYPYALKTFQQRYLTDAQRLRQAFEQEVATWVALEKHPNIVRCFYMTTFDNQPFMVLEWIAGEEGRGTDLRSWLRHGPLDLKLALEIALDICHGLLHAQAKHPEQRFVHRDLKPENILMAQGGLAKITDFGLAQIVKAAELATGLESAVTASRHSFSAGQGITGTPAYMAPEQWRGEPLDVCTDIYALGCILYELLTGRWPFDVNFTPTTPQQMQTWLQAMQTAHETMHLPKLPAAAPPDLDELVQCCLCKTPTARPTSVAALTIQLSQIYEQQFDQNPPARPIPAVFTSVDYNNRGNTYHALQQYEQALADFGRAIDLDPNYAGIYYNRGLTHVTLQNYGQALVDFGWAIDLDPNYDQAYYNRGLTYYAIQKYEQALIDYGRALDIAPGDAKIYNNRGITYKALQEYKQALINYTQAINLDPSYAQAYYNRGILYAAIQEYKLALADYGRAIDLNPNDAETFANRGIVYATLHDYERALADFNRAIDLDPSHAQAYNNRGITYKALHDYEQALADFKRAIDLDSNFVGAYYSRGNTYAVLHDYERALVDFKRAIDLDPKHVQAYTNRGNVYTALQKYEYALKDYTRAIALDPNHAQAYFNLGAMFANRGQLYESLPYLKKADQLGHPQGSQAIAQVRQILGTMPAS